METGRVRLPDHLLLRRKCSHPHACLLPLVRDCTSGRTFRCAQAEIPVMTLKKHDLGYTHEYRNQGNSTYDPGIGTTAVATRYTPKATPHSQIHRLLGKNHKCGKSRKCRTPASQSPSRLRSLPSEGHYRPEQVITKCRESPRGHYLMGFLHQFDQKKPAKGIPKAGLICSPVEPGSTIIPG